MNATPVAARRFAVSLACLGLVLTTPRAARSQSARVEVNGVGDQVIAVRGNVLPGASGSATAAARVVRKPETVLKVNGAAANAAETTVLDGLLRSAAPIAGATPLDRRAYFTGGTVGGIRVPGMSGLIRQHVRPNADPARFPDIAKGARIESATGMVVNSDKDVPAEIAEATARQTLDAVNNNYRVLDSTVTVVQATRNVRNPLAIAMSVNRDPLPIEWSSLGSREFSLDLSGLTFDLQTTGVGGRAFGFFGADVGMVDGVSEVEAADEEDAVPLFELFLAAGSEDGGAPFVDVPSVSFELGSSEVRDNFGNSGRDDVLAELLKHFKRLDSDTVGFDEPYLMTFRIPGSQPNSVLFLRDYAGSVAAAVPEGRVLASVAPLIGLLLWTVGHLRRRRIAAIPS